MRTMNMVAVDFLTETKTSTFKQVWTQVLKELKDDWKEIYEPLSIVDIEKIKIGELYAMLTTDGEFVKNEKDKWSLSKFFSFEEVQKMKINAGDLED